MGYQFNFSELTDEFSYVEVINRHTNKEYTVKCRIEDSEFINTNALEMSSILADLVDLASSIYIADWLSPQNNSESQDISVRLSLRNPTLFSQSCIVQNLQDILQWYTGNRWYFEFRQRVRVGRLAERQPRQLSLLQFGVSREVALWSGGLDSLAGFCRRIINLAAEQYTLFGTGINNQVQGKQLELAKYLQQRTPERIKLIQVPIRLEYSDVHPPTNNMFRARGFVFKVLGAVCASLEGQQSLYIYENGFGAINLPFQLSEVGMTHPRSVHPISMLKTGRFVSKLLDVEFKYHNPYLFSTKAQMCDAVRDNAQLAFKTLSCDGQYRQANQPSQCGYCSSCLLRRVALINALGDDQTEYVITDGNIPRQRSHCEHFEAMKRQIFNLNRILESEDPWQSLLKHYSKLRPLVKQLSHDQEIARSVIESQLLQLYRCHVKEWLYAQNTLEQSFAY